MKRLELLIPPLLFAGVLMALIAFLSWWLPAGSMELPQPWRYGLASLLALFSFALVLPAAWAFAKANTTVNPRRPDATQALVSHGWYRFTRNPMYLGFLLALISTTLFTDHVSGIFISMMFVPYMNRFQIAPEERFLTQQFGDAYLNYCQHVRRWL